MRKILNGDFTFKMIFAPSFDMPFELVIKSKGDENLLCINSIKWRFLEEKNFIGTREYLGNKYIEFNDGTFYIKQSKFKNFLEEIRKLDYSNFAVTEPVTVDGMSITAIFYNLKNDTLVADFNWINSESDAGKYFISIFDLIFSTLKTEPYITLADNVFNYIHNLSLKIFIY